MVMVSLLLLPLSLMEAPAAAGMIANISRPIFFMLVP